MMPSPIHRAAPVTLAAERAGRVAALPRRLVCKARSGASLVELVVAIAVAGAGVTAVASLTATAARTVAQARSLDEAHAILRSFADSARHASGASTGQRSLPRGTLAWDVPGEPGAAAWAEFSHRGLASPVRIEFAVVADPGITR